MARLNFKSLGLISLALTLIIVVESPAQQISPDETLSKVKNDLENLYQQWRQAKPKDPLNYNAFRVYLELSRIPVLDQTGPAPRWNSDYAFSKLPSNNIILRVYEPVGAGLASFLIDTNPAAYPNILPGDTQVLTISQQGQVSSN